MLKICSLDNKTEWDNIVKSFNDYDIYYLSGYAKLYFLHGDGIPLLIYFNNDKVKAINVVLKRDITESQYFYGYIEKNIYFDFITPYGYGGFIIENQNNEEQQINEVDIIELKEEYEGFCQENNIISEFVRFHPLIRNYRYMSLLYDLTKIGNTISVDLTDADNLWANFSSKNRNMCRKAIKNGVKIEHSSDKVIIEEFISLYNKTMDRDNADKYYYFDKNYYYTLFNEFGKNAEIFYALYNERIISAAIIFYTNKYMHYHLSGSASSFKHLAPTNLLLYEVALWGHKMGFEVFHLGGGVGGSEDNLYKFKKSFNRNEDNPFYIGKKIYNKSIYEKLVNIRMKESTFDKESNFFPLYRSE
ncbi:peptidoglycan bridge formation glycyltransferase FemA/FemB family protein [Soehngenia saccharolytica]|nr:peptidoglycan bridge formation glycyltransferase FemA/FemB family protein [Soehngenia saccharolytica]